jgi:hypothetical protein
MVPAHRFAYELEYGPVPAETFVDHHHLCPKRCVRSEHLRIATMKQNIENAIALRSTNSSGVRGVWLDRTTGRWQAQVTHHGKRYWAGSHAELKDAEEAVVLKRNELFTHNDIDRGR